MNVRYKLLPQLKCYDLLGSDWVPYLIFQQTKNFRSEILNTDSFGLRFNNKVDQNSKKTIFDENNSKKKCVVVGASSAFGVGSTTDSNTIPSFLSAGSDYHYYNFGARAYNGFQELILYQSLINKIDELEKVIIFSGFNDICHFSNENFKRNYLGDFFFSDQFYEALNNGNLSFNRKVAKFLFGSFVSNEINWNKITKKNLIKYLFNSEFRRNFLNNSSHLSKEITPEDIISRNLKMWSTIAKGTGIKIYYFFQPFLDWCKDFSKDEEELVNFTEKNIDNNVLFNVMNKVKKVDLYNYYNEILSKSCKSLEIPYFDCNEFLKMNSKKTDWLFADRAHLTDSGNFLISEFIKSKI